VLRAGVEWGVARHADAVLPISPWDAEHYWSRLTSRRKISYLPYYLPRDYERPMAEPGARELSCLCVTSVTPNPMIADSLVNFEAEVAGLDEPVAGAWHFSVSGALAQSQQSSRIRPLGVVPDLQAHLGSVRLVAVLSDYGYGFKTKLLDAIAAGCWVAVTPMLKRRLPALLDPWVLTVDLSQPAAFAAALQAAERPPPAGGANEQMRALHHQVMSRLVRDPDAAAQPNSG
jgi:hypothetical protein